MKYKNHLVGGGAICLAIVVVIFLIAWFSKAKNEDQPLDDCHDDGFQKLDFNSNFFKYRIIEKSSAFHVMQNVCLEAKSNLWDVNDGPEWDAVLSEFKSKNRSLGNFWLNGRVVESTCPDGEECNNIKKSSAVGKGFPIQWLTDSRLSTYSRLIKQNSIKTELWKHVFIQDTADLLWAASESDQDLHFGLCIKRNCKPE